MTLSPDVAQFLAGPVLNVPPPPIPFLVKALIHQRGITRIRRTSKSGKCTLTSTFSGLVMINGVWFYIHPDTNICYVVHSHFETIVKVTRESPAGIIHVGYDIFHADEAFPCLSRSLGTGALSIQVRRRRGCWPSFTSAENAQRLYCINPPLLSLHLSHRSSLWFAQYRNKFRCIVCGALFNSRDHIASHFSLM